MANPFRLTAYSALGNALRGAILVMLKLLILL